MLMLCQQDFDIKFLVDQKYFPRLKQEDTGERVKRLSDVELELSMQLMPKMREIIRTAMSIAEPTFSDSHISAKQFAFYWFDFFFDADQKTFLQGVVASPSFSSVCKVEEEVKASVLLRGLDIVGLMDNGNKLVIKEEKAEVKYQKEKDSKDEAKAEQQPEVKEQQPQYYYDPQTNQYYQYDPQYYQQQQQMQQPVQQPIQQKEEPKPIEQPVEQPKEAPKEEPKEEKKELLEPEKQAEGGEEEQEEKEKPAQAKPVQQQLIKPVIEVKYTQISDEDKVRVLHESQYFDYGLYSHLINELRTKTHKFVKLEFEKLSNYEKNILNRISDEQKRNKGFTRMMPTTDVQLLQQMVMRRYLNELCGCMSLNGWE